MPKTEYYMTHHDAKLLMSAAVEAAAEHQVPGAIAIVDSGSNLMLLERLDDTMIGASNIAIGKAATAVAFGRPTIDLENVILEGRSPMLVLDSATSNAYVPLKGGYPVRHKEQLLGAIAVAGTMSAEMDEVVALAALQNRGW